MSTSSERAGVGASRSNVPFVPGVATGLEVICRNFKAMPSLNKMLVLELARGDYITRNENIIAVGKSGTFGSERLTGPLLDRLTHRVHMLEMNGDSFRLKHSRQSGKA